jgi:hypothetical protein
MNDTFLRLDSKIPWRKYDSDHAFLRSGYGSYFHKERSVDEKSVFLDALNMPAGNERTAWLDDVCSNDLPLRARVDALLRRHEQAGQFLEHPPSELDATFLPEISNQDRVKALQAGLAAAFAEDQSAIIGSAGHSVLKRLAQSIQVPHVALRESLAKETIRSCDRSRWKCRLGIRKVAFGWMARLPAAGWERF